MFRYLFQSNVSSSLEGRTINSCLPKAYKIHREQSGKDEENDRRSSLWSLKVIFLYKDAYVIYCFVFSHYVRRNESQEVYMNLQLANI